MMLNVPGLIGIRSGRVRAAAFTLLTAGMLQACGGGGDAGIAASGNASAPGSANHAPTIAGTAPAQALAGQAYTFTPTATDSDGDSLTFSIANKPAWASFDSSSGRLSGTPSASSVGSFADVIITVSDGTAQTSLSAFSITVGAVPGAGVGSATLSWTPPTQRTDGSGLTNLAGYRIRYGTTEGDYTTTITVDSPGVSTYQIDNLSSGTYYFVVTAYDSAGVESDISNTASKTIA